MNRRTIIATIVFAAVLALVTEPALAASGNGEEVGVNVGHLLQVWGKQIFLGIVAIAGLGLLFSRKYADLALFGIAAVVVGGFVLAPGTISAMIRGIWDTIAG